MIQFKWVGYPAAKAVDEALDKRFKEAEWRAKTAPRAGFCGSTDLGSRSKEVFMVSAFRSYERHDASERHAPKNLGKRPDRPTIIVP